MKKISDLCKLIGEIDPQALNSQIENGITVETFWFKILKLYAPFLFRNTRIIKD